MRHNHTSILPIKQSGSALVISMIILIMLMLLGVTAVTTSNTQFQMAGNLQFQNVSLNNAEAAISNAEIWLSNGTNFDNTGFTTYDQLNTPQLYPTGSAVDPLTTSWDNYDSVQVNDPVTGSPNPNQRYFIEQLSTSSVLIGSSTSTGGRQSSACNKVNTYRITARGASARGATKYVVSYYSVLKNNGDPTVGC